MKDLPLSLARGRLLLGQDPLLKLHVYPAWYILSLGWRSSVLWLCTPHPAPAYDLGPLSLLGYPEGIWIEPWNEKINLQRSPPISPPILTPRFSPFILLSRGRTVLQDMSIFRTVRYISYIPLLSLNFPFCKAYVILPSFIHLIECRDGRMRYGRWEHCMNSECPLLVSASSFHCPAPWSHSPAQPSLFSHGPLQILLLLCLPSSTKSKPKTILVAS